jgi:hypothetical protein
LVIQLITILVNSWSNEEYYGFVEEVVEAMNSENLHDL